MALDRPSRISKLYFLLLVAYSRRVSSRRRGRKAWLVTWDWAGDHAAVPEREVIAAILRPRTGPDTVKRIVELLYMARQYDPTDKLDALTHNPYPVRFGTARLEETLADGTVRTASGRWAGEMFCGHNPFLHARLVENLRPRDPTNPEGGLVWDERPRPVVRFDYRSEQ